ncbi:hypothetical protein KTR66_23090 [Roseococcus sp. SDR]|uniref:hypothetical protein n=1 Tax=Roseococcus sp. SDR TaxID=2835532 RepID=UPI001BD18410|nr:hypothetical protein [Roseococcus sp. SDR]MBS7792894.1 hypothetical protein [Roseococcus sp. SDR]MBV1848208.1 hypothetical protein [Roseococcus sp. SDR]
MTPLLGLAIAGLLVLPAPAQTSPSPATTPQAAAPAPRAEAPPRPRPRDPRDRAFMDGGIALTPGFSGSLLGQGMPSVPQAQLAPRPNLDIEARPVAPSQSPTLTPTMIHPRVPSRSAATDPAPTHPDQRLLQTPAPGARLNVPLTW